MSFVLRNALRPLSFWATGWGHTASEAIRTTHASAYFVNTTHGDLNFLSFPQNES
jgi:hypothetical protein